MYACMYVCMYVRTHVCSHVCMYYVCMYTRMHVCNDVGDVLYAAAWVLFDSTKAAASISRQQRKIQSGT
jgi:hypothetical protein